MLTFLVGFILGIIAADTVGVRFLRLMAKLPSVPVREIVREAARERGIDLQEKGQVLKVTDWNRVRAAKSGKSLMESLDEADRYGDTE